jgi:hypothetical protein
VLRDPVALEHFKPLYSDRLLELIESEIEKKFVKGDADGRKGIAQLSNSIERFLNGEAIC